MDDKARIAELEAEIEECSEVLAKLAVDLAERDLRCRELEAECEELKWKVEEQIKDRQIESGYLRREREKLEAKIADLEAKCAAMREALERIQKRFLDAAPKGLPTPVRARGLAWAMYDDARSALLEDDGRALLERIEALEWLRAAFDAWRDTNEPMDGGRFMVLLDARRNLDALETKP